MDPSKPIPWTYGEPIEFTAVEQFARTHPDGVTMDATYALLPVQCVWHQASVPPRNRVVEGVIAWAPLVFMVSLFAGIFLGLYLRGIYAH